MPTSLSDRLVMHIIEVHQDTGTKSDHFLITSILEIKLISKAQVKWEEKVVRHYNKIDLKQFCQDICDSKLTSKVCQSINVEEAIQLYNTTIRSLMDKHAPKISKWVKANKNSWWNSECQNEKS